jgi:hypothetical protein
MIYQRIFLASILLGLSACSIDKESMTIFLAKESCSCVFLVGQSEKRCRDAIRIPLAFGDIEVDYKKKQVTGRSEDGRETAVVAYVNERFGCELRD